MSDSEPAAKKLQESIDLLEGPLREFFLEELRLAREARKIAYKQIEPARNLVKTAEQWADRLELVLERLAEVETQAQEAMSRVREMEARYGIFD